MQTKEAEVNKGKETDQEEDLPRRTVKNEYFECDEDCKGKIKAVSKERLLSEAGMIAHNTGKFLSNKIKLNDLIRKELSKAQEINAMSEGAEEEVQLKVEPQYDSEPATGNLATLENVAKLPEFKYKEEGGAKRKRITSEGSEDSEACAERDHSKKKWRVELSDEQLDILMRCSNFKDKVQRRLKRKAAVKRLQRSGKKLRRGSRNSKSRVVSSSSSDSDSSEEETRKETLPLSKPNNNQEKDVLGDIDELLKDSGDETAPVATTPPDDWRTRARVLDERSLKRVSRRFSAELEELNGNACNLLFGNVSNGFILQLTAEPMTMRARKELPSDVPGEYNVRNLQGSSDKGFTNLVSGTKTKKCGRQENLVRLVINRTQSLFYHIPILFIHI